MSSTHHGHDHAHHHGHTHGSHQHGHSYAQANAELFDKQVESYEDVPGARELIARFGSLLRETGSFDKEKTAVLDFACGVGASLHSQLLADDRS